MIEFKFAWTDRAGVQQSGSTFGSTAATELPKALLAEGASNIRWL
jgi:hypothetical protein